MREMKTDLQTPSAEGGNAAALEPMLTPEQVAKLLNVSKATLCRLTKRGAIPHKRLGDRVVRYVRSAVVAWMTSENP
jgi:excisionase family DNA binding protein